MSTEFIRQCSLERNSLYFTIPSGKIHAAGLAGVEMRSSIDSETGILYLHPTNQPGEHPQKAKYKIRVHGGSFHVTIPDDFEDYLCAHGDEVPVKVSIDGQLITVRKG